MTMLAPLLCVVEEAFSRGYPMGKVIKLHGPEPTTPIKRSKLHAVASFMLAPFCCVAKVLACCCRRVICCCRRPRHRTVPARGNGVVWGHVHGPVAGAAPSAEPGIEVDLAHGGIEEALRWASPRLPPAKAVAQASVSVSGADDDVKC